MRWALGVLAFALGLGAGLWGLEGGLRRSPFPWAGAARGPSPSGRTSTPTAWWRSPSAGRRRWSSAPRAPPQREGPWAVVAEGDRVLWQGEVLGLKEVRVRTTGRGVLVLAFLNDLYAPPEDRNLFLRGLKVR